MPAFGQKLGGLTTLFFTSPKRLRYCTSSDERQIEFSCSVYKHAFLMGCSPFWFILLVWKNVLQLLLLFMTISTLFYGVSCFACTFDVCDVTFSVIWEMFSMLTGGDSRLIVGVEHFILRFNIEMKRTVCLCSFLFASCKHQEF